MNGMETGYKNQMMISSYHSEGWRCSRAGDLQESPRPLVSTASRGKFPGHPWWHSPPGDDTAVQSGWYCHDQTSLWIVWSSGTLMIRTEIQMLLTMMSALLSQLTSKARKPFSVWVVLLWLRPWQQHSKVSSVHQWEDSISIIWTNERTVSQ